MDKNREPNRSECSHNTQNPALCDNIEQSTPFTALDDTLSSNLALALAPDMNMSTWHKTENDSEALKHSQDFWHQHSEDIESGSFWADRIRNLKSEPEKRLALAIKNLPLPAAFREAAVAARALVRSKRKSKDSYKDELALLYWLAAINSFSIPYSQTLKEPGYNVVESIPSIKLKELPFSYQKLGYEKLELLNKTDIKWLIEAWGEPNQHTTLHRMHFRLWTEYEKKLKAQRRELGLSFKLAAEQAPTPPEKNETKNLVMADAEKSPKSNAKPVPHKQSIWTTNFNTLWLVPIFVIIGYILKELTE